jgi:acyl-CoA synthetase (AMP-forming)/AMP-acid ligase II
MAGNVGGAPGVIGYAAMRGAISDGVHIAKTFAKAGVLKPGRPDRALRAVQALRRWGPTLASGYMGAAARYPDAPGIVDERGVLTFEQIERRTNALARGLAGYGLLEGDRVAIMCRNHRGFVEMSTACSKLGAHAIYLNTSFAGPQVSAVVSSEAPRAVVYDQEFAPVLGGARADRLGFVAWCDDPGSAEHPVLDELIATRCTQPLPPPEHEGRSVILTSGTTGAPKGANRPNPGSVGPAAALLSAIPLHARGTTVIAAPLFHSWGFAHMLMGTVLASTLVLQRRFDPADTLQAIEDQCADALVVVPVMLQRILELGPEQLQAHDTSTLGVIAVSGSALPGPLAQRVMDVFGDVLYNLYGSTEVAWATVAAPADMRAAPGTAGRPPRGTVVSILDDEDRELPPGQTGRIFVGSDLLFEGYTGGGNKARVGSLMATGDVGHFDDSGRLFVDGRDDDMIVSGGENVFPSEVEDLLAGFPGVVEVAVVGVPDEEFGQRMRAFVVAEPGSALTDEQLKKHVHDNLARYKVPRDIEFVDALPRNATGKVLKRQLS